MVFHHGDSITNTHSNKHQMITTNNNNNDTTTNMIHKRFCCQVCPGRVARPVGGDACCFRWRWTGRVGTVLLLGAKRELGRVPPTGLKQKNKTIFLE